MKDKKLMPPPPPPDNKRKREGGDDANQMSQRIEKLGLRTASYYKTLTLTEGILRKRLTLIHNLIEARCNCRKSSNWVWHGKGQLDSWVGAEYPPP